MPHIRRLSVSPTTDGAGAATAVVGDTVGGLVQQIVYVPHATNPYADTVTFTITEKDTGRAILATGAITAAVTAFMPRAATVGITNAAALYAGSGTAVNDAIPVVGDVQIVLASGGATNDGTFYLYLA